MEGKKCERVRRRCEKCEEGERMREDVRGEGRKGEGEEGRRKEGRRGKGYVAFCTFGFTSFKGCFSWRYT